MKADSHWMEESVAWWPVLKKWKEPRRAIMMGLMGELVRELVSIISRRERTCQNMRAKAPAPMGFWTRRSATRIEMGRRR